MDAKTPRQTLKPPKNETPSGTSTQDQDYSPLFFPYSQDSCEDLDVMWDYRQSPLNSSRLLKKRVKQKRALFPQSQSPSVPIKVSNSNKTENFEKLRNELFALKESLACTDDIVFVSPQEEVEIKRNEAFGEDINDLSNDSINEQFVQFTQRFESEFNEKDENTAPQDIKSALDDSCMDLFDQLAGSMDIGALSGTVKTSTSPIIQSTTQLSDEIRGQIERKRLEALEKRAKKGISQLSENEQKVQFYSTKSFELNNKTELSQTQLDEAEREKTEALSNLQQEIEKNRLDAIARRESKRLEKIVEQKRKEALQRLRQKNATNVRETLIERL